jgi:hypothetical protein
MEYYSAMANLSVVISDEAYKRARIAAISEGVLLRLWVEQMILRVTAKPEESIKLREPR